MNIEALYSELNKGLEKIEKKALSMEKQKEYKNIDKPIAKEIRVVPDSPEGYRRPYLREDVKKEIYANAPKDANGNYLDPNTGLPIQGKPDIGHKTGHEFRREAQIAFKEGLTQNEFNDKMNNPKYYQLEDLHSNRSHKYESTD